MALASAMGSAVLVGFMSFILLGMMLTPGYWHTEDIPLTIELNIGLHSVYMKPGLSLTFGSVLLQKLTGKSEGGKAFAEWLRSEKSGSLASVVQDMRAMPPVMTNWDSMWENIYYASMFMGFCGVLAIILMILGAVFENYYWNHEPKTSTRLWVLFFQCAGPLFLTMGVGAYAVMTNSFDLMAVIGLRASSSTLYGPAFMMAGLIAVFSWLPLFITIAFSGMGSEYESEYAEKKDPFNKFNEMQDYEGGQAPAYGATQGYPQQSQAPAYGATQNYPQQNFGVDQYQQQPQGFGTQYGGQVPGGPQFIVTTQAVPPPGSGYAAW